jgi:hypothetical protein
METYVGCKEITRGRFEGEGWKLKGERKKERREQKINGTRKETMEE